MTKPLAPPTRAANSMTLYTAATSAPDRHVTESGPLFAVFDCDGTLVDTHGSIVHCMSLAFAAVGRAAPAPAVIRATIGLPLEDGVRQLLPDATDRAQQRIVEAYRAAFFDAGRFERIEEPLFPGIAALLDTLEERGVVLGIATGKIERALNLTLERHGLLARFVTRQTADLGPAKPDPAMLMRAMSAVGATPGRTVMIGDTHYDIRMGKNAGTAAIGVVWGQDNADDLAAAGADFVAREAAEISEWVFRRGI